MSECEPSPTRKMTTRPKKVNEREPGTTLIVIERATTNLPRRMAVVNLMAKKIFLV